MLGTRRQAVNWEEVKVEVEVKNIWSFSTLLKLVRS